MFCDIGDIDVEVFLSLLNSMHPAIQYTMEKALKMMIDGNLVQMLVFLSLEQLDWWNLSQSDKQSRKIVCHTPIQPFRVIFRI